MLVCSKCGFNNQLGRVFCGQCGSKLELSGITTAAVAEAHRVSWITMHWGKCLGGVIVIILIIAGFAFWPCTERIGEKGTPGGSTRVEGQLKSIQNVLRPGMTAKYVFKEADINGYFEYRMGQALKDAKVEFITVKCLQGGMLVRVVKPLLNQTAFGLKFNPTMSYDIGCVPVGGVLIPSKVSQGHLKVVGPVKTSVVKYVYDFLRKQKDWAAMDFVTEIKIDEGQVTVTVTKK